MLKNDFDNPYDTKAHVSSGIFLDAVHIIFQPVYGMTHSRDFIFAYSAPFFQRRAMESQSRT